MTTFALEQLDVQNKERPLVFELCRSIGDDLEALVHLGSRQPEEVDWQAVRDWWGTIGDFLFHHSPGPI